MKKFIPLISLLIILGLSAPLLATTGAVQDFEYGDIYFGVNIIAGIAALQLEENIKRYIPTISGLEYGISICGGYYISGKQALEARLSIGPNQKVTWVNQLHLGINYHWTKGFYSGAFLKIWDYRNRVTDIHFYNIVPYLTLGYRFTPGVYFADIRLNQTIAIYSWSDLAHTGAADGWFFSPWPAFIPILPTITMSIGREF